MTVSYIWWFLDFVWYVLVVQSLGLEYQLPTGVRSFDMTPEPPKKEFDVDHLYYDTNQLSWTEANRACIQRDNGSLLQITTETRDVFIPKIRDKLHPGSVWIGDYRSFDTVFIPPVGISFNKTTKCVALTLTSIDDDKGIVNVKYDLNIQTTCSDSLVALCVCHSGFSNTLNVRTASHGWAFYKANNCGRSCELWTPPFENVTPGDFEMTIGKGNITLRGLGPDLLVGRKYWVNVLATVTEKHRNDSGGIIECGSIVPFSESIVFGSCDITKSFICQMGIDLRRKTTISSALTESTFFPVFKIRTTGVTENHSGLNETPSEGLSTVAIVGIIGGSVVFVVICTSVIIAVSVTTKCCKQSDSQPEFKAKGGRSFVRQMEDSKQTEEIGSTPEDNRNTLYAQIDPNRVRKHPTIRVQDLRQPDIVLTATTSGYLPMDGIKNTISNNAYDVIKMEDMTSDEGGNYVEVDEPVGLYSVSSVVEEEESVYDSTFDRHPSQRMLITPQNTYDKANFVRSPSMENPVCNSVNMEGGYYSSLKPKMNVKNPNYDKIVIN